MRALRWCVRSASDQPTTAATVAETITLIQHVGNRLMRALGSIGLLIENDKKGFRLTDAGALCVRITTSLRATALLEEGPEHYASEASPLIWYAWGPKRFVREFAQWGLIMRGKSRLRLIFNKAMSSMSSLTTDWAVTALHKSHALTFAMYVTLACGHGHLGCALLKAIHSFSDGFSIFHKSSMRLII